MSGGKTMRAAVLEAPGKLVVREVEARDPGDGELVVQVAYAGICGTDLAIVDGTYRTQLPLVLCHEFCGRDVACGGSVPGRWDGAFVTAEISRTCLSTKSASPCAACRRNHASHCLRRTVLGIRGADGAFAERLVVPASQAHLLPPDLSPWAGVLVEPLAAALQTFERRPVRPEETVCVLGTGRLGLLVCLAARSYGARVIGVSRSERSRALSLRFGASLALDSAEAGTRGHLLEETEGLGADVVVECTGSPEGLGAAVHLVRALGTIALKTTCGLPAVGLDATLIAANEITVQGSRCGPFAKAIERLGTGLVPVEDYVSGVFSLEDVADAVEAARRSTKVLIEF